jgi:aldose sugar dehydrogenase
MRTRFIAGFTASSFVAAGLLAAQQTGTPVDSRPANDPNQKPAFAGQTDAPERKSNVAFEVVSIAEGLQNPWALAFLPDGKMLVTERPGRLRVVTPDGKLSEPVTGLPELVAGGQGGLLDVALDPAFQKNNTIYLCYSQPKPAANNTAVARGTFVDGAAPRLENVKIIYEQAPSLNSRLHFGCRLVLYDNGTMLIAQGDRSITEGRMQSQNLDSLIGKVARINTDGSVPKDNPFVGKAGARPEIWSIGHRNIQAAAAHPSTGDLWAIEHGTRGGDELNVVRKGRDYGWPTIAYGIEYRGGPITGGIQQKEGMEQPIYYWDPVIGPSGMAFYTGTLFPAWKGNLFVGGHETRDLVRLELQGEKIVGEERLLTERKERVRDVRQGPDGAIYLLMDAANGSLLKLVPKAGSPQ